MQTIANILARHASSAPKHNSESSAAEPNDSHLSEYAPPPESCICGGLGWFTEDVPVGHKWFGKAHPCCCTLAKHAKRQREFLWRESLLPSDFREKTINDFIANHPGNKAVKEAAIAYITAQLETPWLLIHGPYGNGKTHICCAIIRAFIARDVPSVYGQARGILNNIQQAIKADRYNEAQSHWQRIPLLAIDDLGTEQQTDWARAEMDELIDYRYREGLLTIITTNLPLSGTPGTENELTISPRISRRLDDKRICTKVFNDAPEFSRKLFNSKLGATLDITTGEITQ